MKRESLYTHENFIDDHSDSLGQLEAVAGANVHVAQQQPRGCPVAVDRPAMGQVQLQVQDMMDTRYQASYARTSQNHAKGDAEVAVAAADQDDAHTNPTNIEQEMTRPPVGVVAAVMLGSREIFVVGAAAAADVGTGGVDRGLGSKVGG